MRTCVERDRESSIAVRDHPPSPFSNVGQALHPFTRWLMASKLQESVTMQKYSTRIWTFLILLAVTANAASCTLPSRSLTVVTGKVIYGTMAIEGAEIIVNKWNAQSEKWEMIEVSRSGYHGSFRLHLADGSYRLDAMTAVLSGGYDLELSGSLEPLNISKGMRRMDQLVIELSDVRQ